MSALQAHRLVFGARMPRPHALKRVAYAEGQAPKPLDLQVDGITIHEGVQAPVIGAGCKYVSWFQDNLLVGHKVTQDGKIEPLDHGRIRCIAFAILPAT